MENDTLAFRNFLTNEVMKKLDKHYPEKDDAILFLLDVMSIADLVAVASDLHTEILEAKGDG